MSRPQPDPRFTVNEVRAVMNRQHGLITNAQAQQLGLSADAIRTRVARGELVRVLPRVYRSTLAAPSLHEGALAAVLWAGDGAFGSHLTAARIYGAELPITKPHIWVPRDRNPKSPHVIVHRGSVVPGEWRIKGHVPITSPSRTLADIAGMIDTETLETTVEDFFHRGVTTPMAVERCLDAIGNWPGSRELRRILRDRDQAPANRKLEVKIWRLLRAAGLRPVRQLEVRWGRKKYFLDFAWPALKLAVEGHGFAAHGGRIAHVNDAERAADLAALGWTVLPVTWEAATDNPAAVIDKIRSALAKSAA